MLIGGWESEALREACSYARLTANEAEAVRLTHQGHSYRHIAAALGRPYPAARRIALAGIERLRRAHPQVTAADRAFLRDMFHCLRNVRGPVPATPPVYAPLPGGGGFDRRPVSLRPRPEGEVPEDLLHDPRRFLRELVRWLASSAVPH